MELSLFHPPAPAFFITMNMLKNGIKWLADQQTQNTSETVTIHQDADSRVVQAVICNTEIIDDGENGGSHTIRAFDLIVKVQDLPRAPAPGDRITFKDVTYEVRRDSTGGGFRFADPYQHRYRIHTQIV